MIAAELTWRQVVVLRALAKYLRQCGFVFSQDFIASTLGAYPEIAANLVRLFEVRFDPRVGADRDAAVARIDETLADGLAAVPSLDADRILRAFLTLIRSTLRTSYFQRATTGRPKEYVAFKFDARAIDFLPKPRPMVEVFVYSPNFEGVHMRYGRVARGGLRWSDRKEDFRTEILGLVKAQKVKNTVIMPVGAKGGFVLKRGGFADGRKRSRPRASPATASSSAALLDITDNLDAGKRSSRRRTWCATTATTRTSWSPPTRAPRRSPTSPTPSPPNTGSGSATPSRPAARSATTTRRWASPRAAPGSP